MRYATNIRGQEWQIVIDPDHPEVGYSDYPTITMQRWDDRVFLHEILHAALASTPIPEAPASRQLAWWRYIDAISPAQEEALVRHLTAVLFDDVGVRLQCPREVATN
jgi:hypothetical protein